MRRGDIYHVDLDPTLGHEQRGSRPVLIVSPTLFNNHNPPLVAPITGGGLAARYGEMAVSVMGSGCKTTGVVLCNQIRTLDVKARNGKFIERLAPAIVDVVVARIADVYELN